MSAKIWMKIQIAMNQKKNASIANTSYQDSPFRFLPGCVIRGRCPRFMTCRHDDRIRHRPVGMKSRSEPRNERTGIGYLAWERGLRCSLERIDRRADGRVEVVFVDPLCDPGGAERLRIGPFKPGYHERHVLSAHVGDSSVSKRRRP